MTDMTAKEMVDKLVENVVMYGTGFTKLTRDEQGNLVTSIVPIEDYMYVNGKPEWQGLTPQDMPDGEDPMFDHPFFIAGMVWAANKLKEKNT